MQTTGATLLAVKRCSVVRAWMTAEDSRSALRLLYLAAVRHDGAGEKHCQGCVDIGSASLTVLGPQVPVPPLLGLRENYGCR